MAHPARHGATATGFTLIGMLILVAGLGILLAAAGEIWHTVQKREKERELLFAGDQFRQALDRYYLEAPSRGQRYPANLEDLLEDPRVPGMRRHLRRIYRDPMTGRAEWGLVRGAAGEIVGVHSLSGEAPLKTGSFALVDKEFAGQSKYSDWLFMSAPR